MKNYDEVAKNVLARRDEHVAKVKKRNKLIMQIGVPTVSLCLAVIVGIGMWQSGEITEPPTIAEDAIVPGIDDLVEPGETEALHKNDAETGIAKLPGVDKPQIKETAKVECPEECPKGEEDIIQIIPWGEMALYQKYPEFELGGTTYTTAAKWIDEGELGDAIGTSTAHGYDIYTDTAYEMGVTVYEINGINTAAAVAVSYNGFAGQYAVYTDHWYHPETLGDFIDVLNLRENLTFGTIYHTFWEYESYMTVEYKISDPSIIWDMLMSHVDLKNVVNEVTDYDMSFYKESMSISVNVDILGVKNVSLSVTENGYIQTNILATRKLFYIGEEKAQEFFNYVEANFEGVREEPPSTTTAVTAPTEPEYPEDTVVVQTSPAYNPEIAIEE